MRKRRENYDYLTIIKRVIMMAQICGLYHNGIHADDSLTIHDKLDSALFKRIRDVEEGSSDF